MGLFSRKKKLDEGLAKTRKGFFAGILDMLNAGEIDDHMYEDLEEQLILADTGADEAVRLVEELRTRVRKNHIKTASDALAALKDIITDELVADAPMDMSGKPAVILMIGVNGVGKTTSVGKLAGMLKADGRKVLIAAADTFRAAAGEQLAGWANRAGVDMIGGAEGSDPASVLFDAVNAAKARHADVLLCDTAGRLHNKKNLMEELKKMNRIIDREFPNAHRENLVVLDGTTGQNALQQAREFGQVADLTGIILTKMDGTAKGGIAVAIQSELNVPVKYIGVGEDMEDLQKFDPDQFVNALFDVKKEEEG